MISSVMYDSTFYKEQLDRYTNEMEAALKATPQDFVQIERLLRWIEVTEQYLAEAMKAGF